jgi:hypothetical protein
MNIEDAILKEAMFQKITLETSGEDGTRKTTLKTSGEDLKCKPLKKSFASKLNLSNLARNIENTLETSGEDAKTTPQTSVEDSTKEKFPKFKIISTETEKQLLNQRYSESKADKIRYVKLNTTVSFHSFAVVQYDCKFP